MSKFEDQLLDDLMRTHGPALATAERPKSRNTKPVWIAAGAVALAGATTGVVMLTSSEQPAYAVTSNADGSVTVSVNNVAALDQVNKELEKYPSNKGTMASQKCDTVLLPSMPLELNKDGVATINLDTALKDAALKDTPVKLKAVKNENGQVRLEVLKCESTDKAPK